MEIIYVSPSYKRGETCSTHKVYPCFEYIIAENESEKYLHKKIIIPNKIQGNISRVRNYILNKFIDKAVVMMDDDCEGIYRWDNCKSKMLNENEFQEFCENMIQMILDSKLKYGGVNIAAPNDKGAYSEYSPFSFTSPVLGPFCIHVNSEIRYDENIPLKEDYDLSLQHLNKYKGILRANAYSYKVKQAENKGGCSIMRNSNEEKRQFELLQKKWGNKIISYDNKSKKSFDFNPIIRTPLKGI